LLALAVGQKLTIQDLLRMPFYHPTLEEGLRTALRTIARQLPPCSISDLAGCGPMDAEALAERTHPSQAPFAAPSLPKLMDAGQQSFPRNLAHMHRLQRSVTTDEERRRQSGCTIMASELSKGIEHHIIEIEVFGREIAPDSLDAFALIDENQQCHRYWRPH